jgi:hypothetical protein
MDPIQSRQALQQPFDVLRSAERRLNANSR